MVWEDVELGTFYTDAHSVFDSVYTPGFLHATRYVRDTGNFGSNVYRLMGIELLDFILRDEDNSMVLVTSMEIAQTDLEALFSEHEMDSAGAKSWLINEFNRLLNFDETLRDPVALLLALVHSGKLRIVVNLRRQHKVTTSIDHAKSGLFINEHLGDMLCFTGSLNETYPAVVPDLEDGNVEQFHVYRTSNRQRGETWQLFAEPVVERLLRAAGAEKVTKIGHGTIAVPFHEFEKSDFPSLSTEDWDPENHRESAKHRSKVYSKFAEEIAHQDTDGDITATKLTENRPHQKSALQAWRDAGYRGILQHATGSGKTITAIAAMEDHLSKEGNFVVLVVPFTNLQKQWSEILQSDFGITAFGIGGDGSKQENEVLLQLDSGLYSTNSVLVVVQNTFVMPKFINAMISGGEKISRRVLFVFDECHHLARPGYAAYVERGYTFPTVLGLSATPFEQIDGGQITEAPHDEKWALDSAMKNDQIRTIAGDVVHYFGLKEAIELGYLCPYEYEIYTTHLTEGEQHDFEEFRSQIGKMMHLESNPAIHQSRLLLKSISGKIRLLESVIAENFKQGQHWLVYCAHSEFLESVKAVLRRLEIPWWEYTSHNKPDRDFHMSEFERAGGVLLAVKCLDEGVDVPKISHGIILSSSTKEREFVQRRGRMLRSAPGKKKSVIFDVICLPHPSVSSKDLIDAIVGHEVTRVSHFAEDALNSDELRISTKSLLTQIKILQGNV